MKLKLLASAFALGVIGVAAPAQASIITALASSATVVGGTAYTYNVSLTDQQQLDAVVGGTPVEFGTLYDFGTIVGTITSTGLLASSFNFSTALTMTPANLTAPSDDPTLTNIRFTYNGSSNVAVAGSPTTLGAPLITVPVASDNLGTFTVVSPFAGITRSVAYDGQARKGTNNTPTGNVGFTVAPNQTPTVIPEPASLALLGAGLFGAGLIRRRQI